MGGVAVWCECNSGNFIVNVCFDGNLRKLRFQDMRQAMKMADDLATYGKLRYSVA